MNSVDVTPETTSDVLLIALVACGSLAFLVLAFVGPQRRARIAQILVQGSLVAVVIGVIIGFTGATPVWFVRLTNRSANNAAPHRFAAAPSSARAVAQPVVESTVAQSEMPLPEWTQQATRVDGNRMLVVVNSGRFASAEEAELHGFEQAAVAAAKHYSSLDPRGTAAVQPQHADIVSTSALKQRFFEVTQHDFGKFQAPMYQLWMQVELTPELGERLAEPWRQAAVESRLRTLMGWSLWSTAAAALAAFALRLDAAWNGRRRAVVAGTAIALALGSLAILG